MGPSLRPPPRIKVSSIAKAKKPITRLEKSGFDQSEVKRTIKSPKPTYRCPVTIESTFSAPTESQVIQFYEARCAGEIPFDYLPHAEKVAWGESLHDNMALMGFMTYSQLLPSLLRNRIKLQDSTYHWNELDSTTDRGRAKLEQRQSALSRLTRPGSISSVLKGLPYSVDKTNSVLQFMGMEVSEDDERYRFFTRREFSVIYGERGQVASSSVYNSCSSALSLLYSSTAILGRPCCFESIVLPLSVTERITLEQTFGCPGQHLDGTIRGFGTKWSDVFATIGVSHRTMDYVMLERACEQKYVEGLHVADAFAVFRAAKSTPRDSASIEALVRAYKRNSKKGFETGAVVGICEVLRARPAGDVGRIDGAVLGAIATTFGPKTSLEVQAECMRLQDGASLFDGSVSSKLGEIIAYFDDELYKARKRLKVGLNVNANLDPAGLRSKIKSGRMLDPQDPASVERMHAMLRGLSRQVWSPLKALIGHALGSSREYPSAFLVISTEEADRVYERAREEGVTYADVANLCTLLMISFAFQRSQVLRDSTVHEFALVPDGTHYKLTFKERTFKTATASVSGGALPVSSYNLSPDQSMIIKFIASVGHRFCGADMRAESRRLLLNAKGQNWTQGDVSSRFKMIGQHWLNIPNFSPHVCRTFWSTYALSSGKVDPSNIENFSSFLQVSSATLRGSYMSAGANSAAHDLGASVLGGVVSSACTGEATEKAARPSTKKLGARRMEFIAEIRASLAKRGGNARLLFRELVSGRRASQLGAGDEWFLWDRTFFEGSGEKFFKRFVDAHVAGV